MFRTWYVPFFLFLSVVRLQAWTYDPFVNVSVGYRQDKVYSRSITYQASGTTLSQNELNATIIRLVEGGVLGGIVLCDDWLLLADVNFGGVLSGDYSEQVTDFGFSKINHKISDGNSQD